MNHSMTCMGALISSRASSTITVTHKQHGHIIVSSSLQRVPGCGFSDEFDQHRSQSEGSKLMGPREKTQISLREGRMATRLEASADNCRENSPDDPDDNSHNGDEKRQEGER